MSRALWIVAGSITALLLVLGYKTQEWAGMAQLLGVVALVVGVVACAVLVARMT